MKKEKKRYVADFETTTNPDDCRVWCFSITEIGDEKNTYIGKDIQEFFDHIKTLGSCIIYFHNLAFDGQFIIYYLLTHDYTHTTEQKLKTKEFSSLISDDGVFYSLKVKLDRYQTIEFYDSLKKLPFSVSAIAKNFDLPEQKGEIDYNKERPIGYELDEEEREYVTNDTVIVSKALKHQFDEGLTKMTIASDALNSFKELSKFNELFPVLDDEIDNYVRHSYRGGWVYANPTYQDKDVENLQVFDVNSLYPSRMYECELPYDNPTYYQGEYQYDPEYPLFICRIQVAFSLKEHHLPTIQIKHNLRFIGTEYITSCLPDPVELILTSVDLKLFFDMYNVYSIKYIDGYKFKSIKGIFKDYIDKWNKVKMDNTGEGGKPALRTIAKLMLNSLYGKFASRTHVKTKIPYLKEDGVVGYMTSDEEIKDSIYTPVASFITAYARDKTIRSAFNFMQGEHKISDTLTIYNDKDYFCYADTDSLHIIFNENYDKLLDVDSKKLGFWKLESTPIKGRYLRAKTYIEIMPDEKIDVKCAGMPDSVKERITWDNFHYGFIDYDHKLKPKKVKGGVVLETTPFTIKEPIKRK